MCLCRHGSEAEPGVAEGDLEDRGAHNLGTSSVDEYVCHTVHLAKPLNYMSYSECQFHFQIEVMNALQTLPKCL